MLLSKLKITTAVLLAVLGMVSFTCGMLARGQTGGKDNEVEKTSAREGLVYQKNGLALIIVPTKPVFATDQPLSFDVTLKNVSTKPFTLLHAPTLADQWSLRISGVEEHQRYRVVRVRERGEEAIPGPLVLKAGDVSRFKLRVSDYHGYVWDGEQAAKKERLEHLPPGKYTLVASITCHGATKNVDLAQLPPLWVNEIVTEPVAFEVSDKAGVSPIRPKNGGSGSRQGDAVAKDEGLAVKKDGVVFEIVLPERDWSIPENKPGSSSAFIKLGLQITNKTDKPLRFNGYDTICPEMVTPDAKEVHRWEGPQGTLRHRQPQEIDYPLVEPGKSATLSLQSDLFWPTLEQRTLMFRWWHASGSPGRYFDDLKPGPYKVRLVYENERKSLEVENPNHKVLNDNVWIGRVVTPFVRVSLR